MKKDTPKGVPLPLLEHCAQRTHRQVDAECNRDDQEYDESNHKIAACAFFTLLDDGHFHQADRHQSKKEFDAIEHLVAAAEIEEQHKATE